MARYDRELLVDYLENIYVLYVADHKIQQKYKQLKILADRNEQGISNPVPVRPEKGSLKLVSLIFLVADAFFWWLSWHLQDVVKHAGFFKRVFLNLVIGLSIIIALGLIIMYIAMVIDTKSSYKDDLAKYEKDAKIYEENKIKNEQMQKKVPPMRKKIGQYSAEHQRITGLINQLYSVNVIPNQYRNVYAVIYLYDYFSGSREDDLAMALNTFVLEEIKSRLDVIIANQGEMLLNQYRMIGNQERALEEQRAHAKRMEEKVDRLNISSDERNQYLGMIASSAASTEYLITRNYIFNG